jgi:hypothetical protein
VATAIRLDHDATDRAFNERSHRPDRVQVVAGVCEYETGAAVEAAIDGKPRRGVGHLAPLDRARDRDGDHRRGHDHDSGGTVSRNPHRRKVALRMESDNFSAGAIGNPLGLPLGISDR